MGKRLIHAIIEIKDGFVKKIGENEADSLVFIRKFDVLSENVGSIIGEPIEFAIYKQQNFQNKKGSSRLNIEPLKKAKFFSKFIAY